VVQGRSFSRVSTYGEHGCGLDEADGAAWCWGHYSDGQLGNGVPVNPPEGGPVAVATHLRFTRIAVGTRFSCGITTSGHTYCWGNNDVGQLGDGTTQGRMLPVRVLGRP
jgi:alpha-tubulin suppressor-like RCC1 family protein